jgi:predicted dehydrogenase
MPEPIRLGYVGCGFVAQNIHLPNFAALEGCDLVAIAELRPRLARQVADRYGVERVYRDHHELAADDAIDAVAVSARYDQQGDIAADLLRAGKHVFVEKPLALSLEQATCIVSAAQEGRARLMVAYMMRHDPGNDAARSLIASWRATGEMGNPVFARSHGFCGDWTAGLDTSAMVTTDEPLSIPTPYKNLPDWLPSEWGERYVEYVQQYTHNINLLRYLLAAGDDASVRSADLDPDGFNGIAILEVAGIRAAIESGSIDFHTWDWHTQVYFERGWVRLSAPPFFVRPSQARLEIYEAGAPHQYRYPVVEPPTAWPYREEAAAFVEALRTETPFRSSGEDTLTDVRLCEEIYKHALATNPLLDA